VSFCNIRMGVRSVSPVLPPPCAFVRFSSSFLPFSDSRRRLLGHPKYWTHCCFRHIFTRPSGLSWFPTVDTRPFSIIPPRLLITARLSGPPPAVFIPGSCFAFLRSLFSAGVSLPSSDLSPFPSLRQLFSRPLIPSRANGKR